MSEADSDKGAFTSSPESRSKVEDDDWGLFPRSRPVETKPETTEESKRVAVATARDLVEGSMVERKTRNGLASYIKLWTCARREKYKAVTLTARL